MLAWMVRASRMLLLHQTLMSHQKRLLLVKLHQAMGSRKQQTFQMINVNIYILILLILKRMQLLKQRQRTLMYMVQLYILMKIVFLRRQEHFLYLRVLKQLEKLLNLFQVFKILRMKNLTLIFLC